jgi:4-diphosphocytidyl-2-C-methyl-D-erythritol kinase
MSTRTRFCPAKVNLFLEVTGKRPNGYHELATLFAKINIGDTLTVTASPAQDTVIHLTLTGPVGKLLQADESNLVCRAARGFLEHYSMQAHIDLLLDKHTPTGAGLGGGSSDAANTLLALCDIFHKDKTDLLPLAAQLGADVPLFMYEDTFLKGEGIGEKLTPVPAPGPLPYLVLAYPNTIVPTKGVFARLKFPSKESILTNVSNLDKLIKYLRCASPLSEWKKLLFNRLEESVVPFTNSVRNVLLDLEKTNTDAVLMSGSGSTVFALVETEKDAKILVSKLQNKERTVFFTTFCRSLTYENNGNKDPSYERGSS